MIVGKKKEYFTENKSFTNQTIQAKQQQQQQYKKNAHTHTRKTLSCRCANGCTLGWLPVPINKEESFFSQQVIRCKYIHCNVYVCVCLLHLDGVFAMRVRQCGVVCVVSLSLCVCVCVWVCVCEVVPAWRNTTWKQCIACANSDLRFSPRFLKQNGRSKRTNINNTAQTNANLRW